MKRKTLKHYLLRSNDYAAKYWSTSRGWVNKEQATIFNRDERESIKQFTEGFMPPEYLDTPLNGRWVKKQYPLIKK